MSKINKRVHTTHFEIYDLHKGKLFHCSSQLEGANITSYKNEGGETIPNTGLSQQTIGHAIRKIRGNNDILFVRKSEFILFLPGGYDRATEDQIQQQADDWKEEKLYELGDDDDDYEQIRFPRKRRFRGNRYTKSIVTEISDDEEEEDEDWEPTVEISTSSKAAARRSGRKRRKVAASNEDNADNTKVGDVNEEEEDEAEVANPKHNESDTRPPKGDGEGKLKDDGGEDASNVAPTQEGEEGLSGEGSWEDDGQNGFDFGGEDCEDVYTKTANHPQGLSEKTKSPQKRVKSHHHAQMKKVNFDFDFGGDDNEGTVKDGQKDLSEKSSSGGVANPKHDESTMRPPEARGKREGDLQDDREEDASNEEEEGQGGLSETMDDGGSRGDEVHNDSDFGVEDDEDENSAGGLQSHVIPATIPNDNEKEQQVVVLESELEKATNEVVKLNEQLSRTFEELEAVKSQSQFEKEQLKSRLKKVEAEIEVKSEDIAQLKEKLEEEKRAKLSWKALWQKLCGVKTQLEDGIATLKADVDKLKAEKNEMQALLHSSEVKKESEIQRLAAELSKSNNEVAALKKQVNELSSELEDVLWQSEELEAELAAEKGQKAEIDAQMMKATTARLKEKAKLKEVTKKFEEADSFWKSRLKEKKVFAMLQEKVEKLKGEVRELTEQNKSLQNQLESTDDEGIEAYWKKPRTVSGAVDVNQAAVNLIAGLEMANQEAELDEARDKIEELSAENKALIAENKELRRKRKVKCSSRTRSSSCLQNASV